MDAGHEPAPLAAPPPPLTDAEARYWQDIEDVFQGQRIETSLVEIFRQHVITPAKER